MADPIKEILDSVIDIADNAIQFEQRKMRFREEAIKELKESSVTVSGIVLDRLEGNVYVAAWQRGAGKFGELEIPITPVFVDSNYFIMPFLFNQGVVVTWTEYTSDGVYRTMYKEFIRDTQ